LASITESVTVVDLEGNVRQTNPAAKRIRPLPPNAGQGDWKQTDTVYQADGVTPYSVDQTPIMRALRGESIEGAEMLVHRDDVPDTWLLASASPLRADDGAMLGAISVFRDITEKKREEEFERERQATHERERNELVQRLEVAVQELSTPVLEIWDDILVLPVIGIIDSRRSAEMMDRLLEAVEQKQCRFVLIDITGVEVVDSATAHQFIKLVTAVEYLGARCVLTGTRSAVAQTLVSLGMDLGPLTMLRTLKHGLRECMRRLEAESARATGKAVIEAARLRARAASG
jgi:rsbT co-antagonist protein RsbR